MEKIGTVRNWLPWEILKLFNNEFVVKSMKVYVWLI